MGQVSYNKFHDPYDSTLKNRHIKTERDKTYDFLLIK